MGKRSKNRDKSVAGSVEITDSSFATEENIALEVKQSKHTKRMRQNNDVISNKIKLDTDQEGSTEQKRCDNIDENVQKKLIKKKKKKHINADNENATDNSLMLPTQNMSNSIVSKVNKESVEKPKKIKFGEDGEPEVVMCNEINKSEKLYLNDEERAIQDDEIDQFCNDIDDEDNKQYENWISLLEQKLGSNECNSSSKNNRRKKKKNNKVHNK